MDGSMKKEREIMTEELKMKRDRERRVEREHVLVIALTPLFLLYFQL